VHTLISANAIWLLDAVADGITIQDPMGRLVYANPAAARATGFATPIEMIETPAAEILKRFQVFDEAGEPLSPDSLPGRRALAGETEVERVIQFKITATGETRWSTVKARPVLNPDGSVRFAVNIWTDMTDNLARQRELEYASMQLEETTAELEASIAELEVRTNEAEELADRQSFLAEAGRMLATSLDTEDTLRMIAHLAVPRIADWATISLVDDEGKLQPLEVAHSDPEKLRFAKALQREYPPDPSQDTGQFRVKRTGRSEVYNEIPDALLEQSARDPEHLRLLRELKLRSAMIVPMTHHDDVLGVISFIRAESKRKNYDEDDLEFAESLAARAALALSNARLYRLAQEANRTKTDFLAVMSHELRTPLTAIFGYTELLQTGVGGPITDAQKNQLERIHASASHLLSIIEEILSYARAEAGHVELHASEVRLSEVVSESLAMVKPEAERKGLAVESRLSEDPVLRTDRAKLRQILINLLNNAVKFTDAGYVRITSDPDQDGFVRMIVEDSGPGIDEAHFDRIFEPFRQLQPSMTRTSGGTGLGLAVSRRFAELMGGTLTVESELGSGSRFTVRLPVQFSD
jgi:PAS domain S-box-containing protein